MNIQTLLIDAVALIVGIVIHESAHALAADVYKRQAISRATFIFSCI